MEKNDIVRAEKERGNYVVVENDKFIVSKVRKSKLNRLYVKLDGEDKWVGIDGTFYVSKVASAELF